VNDRSLVAATTVPWRCLGADGKREEHQNHRRKPHVILP
jgi:hypothetical protein